MARENNFLIGKGELLTEKVEIRRGGSEKRPPYDIATAKERLAPRLKTMQEAFAKLPSAACPNGEVVAMVTLHPRYVSKSDFPTELLRDHGLRAIGNRPRLVRPAAWGIQDHPDEAVTASLFVAGTRDAFSRMAAAIESLPESSKAAGQLVRIEDIEPFQAKEKVKGVPADRDMVVLEVVVQDSANPEVIGLFRSYARGLGAEPNMDRVFTEGSLSFIPVVVHTDKRRSLGQVVEELAKFSFVRVARAMPQMRPIENKLFRGTHVAATTLPADGPINPNVRVAIFDGGISKGATLKKWVNHFTIEGAGKPDPEGQFHGLAVTSAVLFGPLLPGMAPERPYFHVDHYRVIGDASAVDDYRYVDVLDNIVAVLNEAPGKYQFVNLSLGPAFAIDDHDVSSWTARLDPIFARDGILTTVAVGNDGTLAHPENRIQAPSDGVNTLAVAALDRNGNTWARAPYSCVGPGRCPGIVKPDGAAFGGSPGEPFYVLSDTQTLAIDGVQGTSFAAPYVLRAAAGVRAVLGDEFSTLAIKALMIHQAARGSHSRVEVGWGRFETDVARLITCNDDEALVVYQGELPIGQHLRCWLPVPANVLTGTITLSATLAIAADTDPDHPFSYTRDGMEVFFRRDSTNRPVDKKTGKQPAHGLSDSFFSAANMYAAEYQLRDGGNKWEPVLHHSANIQGRTLNGPCFDVYYHTRDGGTPRAGNLRPLPYALLVSLKARAVPDLYNQIVRAYPGILQPIRPTVNIPITIKP